MGGCCCCSSKGTELNSAPVYYYCPRVSEEHLPLSSQHGVSSTLSTGLLVDLNLDTSIPDNYRPPPAPIPYDIVLGRPQTPPSAQDICSNKVNAAAANPENPDSVHEATGDDAQKASSKCENIKGSDCKLQTMLELAAQEELEIELAKSVESAVLTIEEEDACPICLEEYDADNPKLTTKCGHHFHLACILEWMERSETCPVCDQEMIFDPPIDY